MLQKHIYICNSDIIYVMYIMYYMYSWLMLHVSVIFFPNPLYICFKIHELVSINVLQYML